MEIHERLGLPLSCSTTPNAGACSVPLIQLPSLKLHILRSPFASTICLTKGSSRTCACSLPAVCNQFARTDSFCMYGTVSLVLLKASKRELPPCHLFFPKSTGRQKIRTLNPCICRLSTTHKEDHPKLQGDKSCQGPPRHPWAEPVGDLLLALQELIQIIHFYKAFWYAKSFLVQHYLHSRLTSVLQNRALKKLQVKTWCLKDAKGDTCCDSSNQIRRNTSFG